MTSYDSYLPTNVKWLPKIPSHWKLKKLKFLGFLYNGLSGKSSKDFEMSAYSKPYIKFTNIYNNQYIKKEEFDYVKIYNNEVQNKVQKNDIFFLMSSENYEDLGKTSLIDFDTNELYLNSFCKGFRIKCLNTYPKYLNFLLHSTIYKSNISSKGNGFTRINLKIEHINNLFILNPTLNEQKAIASFLDKKCSNIENFISQKTKHITYLKELKTAIINECVTKGLDKTATCKESGIEWLGTIPSHWEVKKLQYLGTLQNGINIGAEYFGKGNPFVSYCDVYNNFSLPNTIKGLVASNEIEKKLYSVEKEDVFFTRTSETIEEIGLSSVCFETIKNATFAGFLIRFRPKKNILHKNFSKYYFRSKMLRGFFVKEMNLVTRASLSQELLKSLPVVLPPLKEQKQIAIHIEQKLDTINKLIEKTTKEIDFVKEYKTSLIDEVVSGKRKVS